jgi:hypothetical protein
MKIAMISIFIVCANLIVSSAYAGESSYSRELGEQDGQRQNSQASNVNGQTVYDAQGRQIGTFYPSNQEPPSDQQPRCTGPHPCGD